MASSLRIFKNTSLLSGVFSIQTCSKIHLNTVIRQRSSIANSLSKINYPKAAGVGGILLGTASLGWVLKRQSAVFAEAEKGPHGYPITRKVEGVEWAKQAGLKLTLYQYQSCPFCSKLRAFLDAYGFAYDVIEVNSVKQTQLKWSKYRKVPILMVKQEGQKEIQLNDSTMIMSVLRSYLEDPSLSVNQLNEFYPAIESPKKGRFGKTLYEYPNKYFIMFGEKELTKDQQKAIKEERKWRRWVDDVLVHMLSPNVYRTPSESLQTFRSFDEVANWKDTFTTFERFIVIYLGASVMWVIGKRLKSKYDLKSDVRESLYDACNEWTKAVGKKRKFMGGEQPNLADLNVYGVLSSIESCDAWQDALKNTNIGDWYTRMKIQVNSHCHADKLHIH